MTTPAAPTHEIGYAGQVTPAAGFWSSTMDEEETPELRWPASNLVYDRMRRQDSQVRSVLKAVTLPILSARWQIERNGARDEVVDLVSTDLRLPVKGDDVDVPLPRARDRFSWLEHLELALLHLAFGHMFFEQVYRIDESGPVPRARLRKLAPRMPRTISAVHVAPDGGLAGIDQMHRAGQVGGPQAQIPVSRLVAYVNDREGANWVGTSLLRPAYKNWLLKDRLLRVQAQTIDRNGMGVPLYEGAEGETSLDKGQEIATSWRSGNAAGAAVPHGAKMRLVGVEGHVVEADPAIRYHDEQIARTVLAHFLNLGTKTGSYALGSTLSDFFTMSLQGTAERIAGVANQHVVEDLVDINFGEDEPAPRIVLEPIGSQQDATAQAIAQLVASGALTSDPRLEQALRTAYGLPSREAAAAVETTTTDGSPA